jgi:hypothetical protein
MLPNGLAVMCFACLKAYPWHHSILLTATQLCSQCFKIKFFKKPLPSYYSLASSFLPSFHPCRWHLDLSFTGVHSPLDQFVSHPNPWWPEALCSQGLLFSPDTAVLRATFSNSDPGKTSIECIHSKRSSLPCTCANLLQRDTSTIVFFIQSINLPS